MKRPVLLAFLLLIVALAGLGVFYSIDAGAAREVRLTEVKLSDLHADINTNGKVEAEKVYELRAPASGLCLRIFAREGSRLKAGDSIIAVDDSSLNSELFRSVTILNRFGTRWRQSGESRAPIW